MEKKRPLPVVARPPSVDTARARLGGRIPSDAVLLPAFPPGTIVRVRDLSGVVVFASTSEANVLVDASSIRRVAPAELAPGTDPELEALAADARVFGTLAEGQSVRYKADRGDLIEGRVVEKCRWGALVERPDGVVVAVGFRKLWPATGGLG